jgi:hypothetical protein
MVRIELTGQKFGRLLVAALGESGKWVCTCDCGSRKEVTGAHLRSGATTSCGCRKREAATARNTTHGATDSPLFNVWKNVIQRCTNVRNPDYKYYGARGISVCARWMNSFEAFREDMGERPNGMTLDRIDGNKPYEPGNCRWATRAEQAVNRSVVTMLTINGRTQCLSHWLKETGVCRAAFWRRVDAGWPIEDAISVRGLKSQHYHLLSRAAR